MLFVHLEALQHARPCIHGLFVGSNRFPNSLLRFLSEKNILCTAAYATLNPSKDSFRIKGHALIFIAHSLLCVQTVSEIKISVF